MSPTLGSVAPRNLASARLELHHAAQLVASVGKTLLEPRADDSHPNLGWAAEEGAFVGHPVPAAGSCQAGLRPDGLVLFLRGGNGKVVEEQALPGQTMASASQWLADAIERHFDHALPGGLVSPGYELPAHPVAQGAAFGSAGDALAELGRWFADAERALGALRGRLPDPSEVRCWPHHFDLATLVALEVADDGAATKTVGLGLSPGDDGYPEPYWYVTPWPYPEDSADLPELPAGRWHREGYTAAILTGTELVAASDHAAFLDDFLAGAFSACRTVHGR